MKTLEILSLFLDMLSTFSGITIGILLFTLKVKEQKGNIYLVLFILSLSIGFLEDIIEDRNLGMISDHVTLLIETDFFIIPSIFLFMLTVARKNISRFWLLLYVPGIVLNLTHFGDPELGEILHAFFYLFLNIPLLIYSFRILRKFKLKLESYYSNVESKSITWVKTIMMTVILVHVYLFFEGIVFLFFENSLLEAVLELILSLVTFFIVYWVGYSGFRQIGFINEVSEVVSSIPEIENSSDKIVTTKESVSKDEREIKYQKCCESILKEKYFANPDLSLKSLSQDLKIKERELSELINSCAKSNFHSFINRFRVDEFKRLLNSDKVAHYSILGLAKDAGFSSKSTFYKVFKDAEGVTPSEYKNGLKSPNTCSRTC
ncbi:helix-turn-helix domain-containing protein [uncultured Tenacibaculum sp.]|uniref:helix-turn-helix domain-containing protein n=1 Tax=uncultured Tenacibaculum sp. TaxID=174713 RepID=UPI002634E2F8|nr:helix-turn-helix domain-containing protein [uncultured Tenacibaculum sp.]